MNAEDYRHDYRQTDLMWMADISSRLDKIDTTQETILMLLGLYETREFQNVFSHDPDIDYYAVY